MNGIRYLYVSVFICLMIFYSSCADEGDPVDPTELSTFFVIDAIDSEVSLGLLAEAIDHAGLRELLSNESTYTFFAPSNDALRIFMDLQGVSEIENLDKDILQNILLYHLIWGASLEEDLITDYVETWSTNSPDESYVSMYINASANVVLNKTSDIILNNIEAENGVLHIIDEVLNLPTIENVISDNEEFSVLLSVIKRLDLDEKMRSNQVLTFFAPNNEAFERFLVALAVEDLAEIPDDTLEDIMLYHFIESNIKMDDFETGSFQTLNKNNNINVEIGPDIRINNHVTLTDTDIQSVNGVVHMIDEVLLPSSN